MALRWINPSTSLRVSAWAVEVAAGPGEPLDVEMGDGEYMLWRWRIYGSLDMVDIYIYMLIYPW